MSNKLTRFLLIIGITVSSALLSIHKAKAAEDLKVGYGKLSLIDLGSLIKNDILVLDESLIRVYTLSGLQEEDKKSVIAIQGLKKTGETDLTVRTSSGIYQFHITLDPDISEDLIINPNNARTHIISAEFPLDNNRMSLVSSPNYINEYVLGGNPNLISVKQVVTDDDPEFLKTFALVTNDKQGKTDVVVATKAAVYKFKLKIGADEHAENISLYIR